MICDDWFKGGFISWTQNNDECKKVRIKKSGLLSERKYEEETGEVRNRV